MLLGMPPEEMPEHLYLKLSFKMSILHSYMKSTTSQDSLIFPSWHQRTTKKDNLRNYKSL